MTIIIFILCIDLIGGKLMDAFNCVQGYCNLNYSARYANSFNSNFSISPINQNISNNKTNKTREANIL